MQNTLQYTPKSLLNEDFNPPQIVELFRKFIEKTPPEIALKANKDSMNFQKHSRIPITFFKNGVDLWNTTRNTMFGNLPVFDLNNNDFLVFFKANAFSISSENFAPIELQNALSRKIIDVVNQYIEKKNPLVTVDIPNNNGIIKQTLYEKLNEGRFKIKFDNIPGISYSLMYISWELLVSEKEANIIKSMKEYYRKLAYINSDDAEKQCVDRKAYMQKIVNECKTILKDFGEIGYIPPNLEGF
ncbi:MAG: hypothetical protein PHG82_02465 [Candidatus Gracilibacteria bacterium]|nr:hypothetical protein [Candidatus Gracilibacteria bacterium]